MVPVRGDLDVRWLGDVEHDSAAVDVAHIGAVGTLRKHIGVVRPEAGVKLRRQARRRRCGVTHARARVPPAPGLYRFGRVGDVNDAVNLVVFGVVRLKVRRARRHVHRLAIHKPDRVNATRIRAGAIEMRNEFRLLGNGDVVDIEAGRLHVDFFGLIGHHHQVAHHVERIGAHLHVRQLGLHNHARVLRVGDINAREVFGSRLVRHPQDAAAVIGFLHGDALAHAAKAIELVVRHQRHVVGHGLLGAVLRSHHLRRGHSVLSKMGATQSALMPLSLITLLYFTNSART